MRGHVDSLHFFDSGDARRRPDGFGPHGARDERVLSGLHGVRAADDGGNGMAVSGGLGEDSHVRLDAVFQVRSAQAQLPADGDFIEDQPGAATVGQLTYPFKETRIRRRFAPWVP